MRLERARDDLESGGFDRVEQQRAHEYIADQVRRHIALRLIGEDGALPSERQLAATFGIGRSTLQKALALLEEEGLLERRRGRNGGTFVRVDEARHADGRRLLSWIHSSQTNVLEALAFRDEIEPATAALAARTAAPDDVNAIVEAADFDVGATDDAAAARQDAAFHLAVARGTGNRFFLQSIEEIRVTLAPVLSALPESRLWYERTAVEHKKIASAIAAHNPEGARRAMRSHVGHTAKSARALIQALELPGACT